MDWQGFYQILFVVLGAIAICFVLSEFFEFIRSRVYRKYIYYHLKSMWRMLFDGNGDSYRDSKYEDEAVDVMKKECERLFIGLVIKDKYLKRLFFSPNDLLLKFISSGNNIVYISDKINIIHSLSVSKGYDCEYYKTEDEKRVNKVQLFEKVSLAGTIIGIIVTIISFFL